MSELPAILSVLRAYHPTRQFSQREVEDRLLFELAAHAVHFRAAGALQPCHLIVVKNPDMKKLLSHIALGEIPIADAPAVIAVLADTKAWKTYLHFLERRARHGASRSSTDNADRHAAAAGAGSPNPTPDELRRLRSELTRRYGTGLFGLRAAFRRIIRPFKRRRRPTAPIFASAAETAAHFEAQASHGAAALLIAAASAGLGSYPVDRFDEPRARRLLGVPRSYRITHLIAVGYPLEVDSAPEPPRLPAAERVSIDLWPNRPFRRKKGPSKASGSPT